MIDRFSMKILDAGDSTEPLELLHRAHTDDLSQAVDKLVKEQRKRPHLLHIIAYPQGNGCSPIPIARDVPISSVCQPITKSMITNALRHPTEISEMLNPLTANEYKPPGLFVICN